MEEINYRPDVASPQKTCVFAAHDNTHTPLDFLYHVATHRLKLTRTLTPNDTGGPAIPN